MASLSSADSLIEALPAQCRESCTVARTVIRLYLDGAKIEDGSQKLGECELGPLVVGAFCSRKRAVCKHPSAGDPEKVSFDDQVSNLQAYLIGN